MTQNLITVMENIAKKKPVKVVICEGSDERCLRATAEIIEKKLCKIVLLGNPNEITGKAEKLNVNISGAEIVDYLNSPLKTELIEKLIELRKHKGMTSEEAAKSITDENYFGCMYVATGYADALVGSAICPTAALMRPALQLLREKGKVASEVSIVRDPQAQRIFFISDASLNINPTSEELAQIGCNAAEVAKMFEFKPKVAFLSYSTKGSGGNGEDLQQIRKATQLAQQKMPEAIVEGELQFDAAVSEKAAARKCPDAKIKGDANVLIFPNLMASNIFAHSMMLYSNLEFSFTMLRGLQKPVGILGRSTKLEIVRNIIVSVAMEANSD